MTCSYEASAISVYVRLLQKLEGLTPPLYFCPQETHVAEVQDEAVALVKAVPANWHLCSPNNTTTFDLEHTLNHHLIGDDVFKP